MKSILAAIIIVFVLIGCDSNKTDPAQDKTIDSNLSPLEVVNKRMQFYNQHNIVEFLKLYAEDVKIYTFPDKLLGTGTANLASIFKPKFANKSIQVEIISQMNNGNHVINHEIVKEDGIDTKYISIYEVENGLIQSVKFVRDK